MDPSERNLIIRNLDHLLELTVCDDVFLAKFRSRDVFSNADVVAIKTAGRNDGQFAEAQKFYDIIQKKSVAFKVLLEALRTTKQTGALNVLDNRPDVNSDDAAETTPHLFNGTPDYITNFVNTKNHHVLVVNSADSDITCQRICETASEYNPNSYNYNDFKASFLIGNANSETCNVLNVVDCKDDIEFMLITLQRVKGKVVLVGKFEAEVECPTHYKVNEIIRWSDLHFTLCDQIKQYVESKLGLDGTKCAKAFKNMEQELLLQFIKGQPPTFKSLFKKTIPDLIQYYIPRQLVTRNVISQSIFSHQCRDIFLIDGITRPELTKLAPEKNVSTSRIAIDEGLNNSTNFVVLEADSDIDKLVESERSRLEQRNEIRRNEKMKHEIKPRPIHLLHHEAGKLTWVKSNEDTTSIQQHIQLDQTVITEHDLVDYFTIMSNPAGDPICISDTPGMGKSMLLRHIATALEEAETSGFVGFLVISELVDETKHFQRHPNPTDHILNTMAEKICQNSLGLAYFQQHSHKLTHLFLDGLDEVGADDVKFAYHILKTLNVLFPSTQLWITTRPHMLLDLENRLGVPGYNIKAFDEKDQLNFLQRFWSQDNFENGDSDQVKMLRSFAHKCLESVKSQINSKEESDIAGIPLQCLLISEVFKKDALDFCNNNDVTTSTFKVKSIADLYRRLVKNKFEIYSLRYDKANIDKDDLKRGHIYYAISLLFPSFLNKFAKELEPVTITLQDILNVGIIESNNFMQAPRFIHRSLAEYFLAMYLVDSLEHKKQSKLCLNLPGFCRWYNVKDDLLFKHVLKCTSNTLSVRNYDRPVETHQFSNMVICYFINAYLDSDISDTSDSSNINISLSKDKLKQVSEACAYSSFDNIFMTLIYKIPLQSRFESIYSERFLILCTMSCGAKMCSAVYAAFKQVKTKFIADIRIGPQSLLHCAVIRGSYDLVVHLMQHEGFLECIKTKQAFLNLVHECVQDSNGDGYSALLEKVDIINYLGDECPKLLVAKDKKGDGPLFVRGIHVKLEKELLSSPNAQYKVKDILKYLHSRVKTKSSKEYYELMALILDNNEIESFADLWTQPFDDSQLVHNLFMHMDPDPQLLNLLKSVGVNFRCPNSKQQTVLQLSIEHRRSRESITWLLDNVSFTDDQLKTSFFHAVRTLNLWTVSSLLTRKLVPANTRTSKNDNMLQYLCKYFRGAFRPFKLKIVQTLIQHGVSPYDVNREGESPIDTLLQFAKTQENVLELVKCISAVTKSNDNKNTLLQTVLKFPHCLRWLLQNVDIPQDTLKKTFIQAVQTANANVVTVLLEGKHVSASIQTDKKENMLFLLFSSSISNCANHYAVAKLLVQNGASLSSHHNVNKTFLDKLIKLQTTQNEDWCNLFDLLLAQVHSKTLTGFHLVKARLLIHRSEFHDKTCIDQNLLDTLRSCLGNIENIDEKDNNGNTLLHLIWLCSKKDNKYSSEMWKTLIDVGANLFILNNENLSPFDKLLYVSNNNLNKLELVMYALNKVPISDTKKINNIIVLTVRHGLLAWIEKLCEWYSATIKKPIDSIYGKYRGKIVTMLDMALLSCDGHLTEYLFQAHKCTTALHPFGKNYIHTCVEEYDAFRRQLKFITVVHSIYPQLVNTPNKLGVVPLSNKKIEPAFIRHLVKLQANVNAVDAHGNTPLHYALKSNRHYSVIETLLECKANANAVNKNLETPLLLALDMSDKWGRNFIFKLLIKNNANPGFRDNWGNTVLHYLPQKCQTFEFSEIVGHLLQRGYADLFKRPGENGLTPYKLASVHLAGNNKLNSLFKKYGIPRFG